MALPQAPNVTFDVYRGFNVNNPYAPPNRPAVLKGVSGYLRHHVRNGKFGYYPAWALEPIYWTNVLEVVVGTDIRGSLQLTLHLSYVHEQDANLSQRPYG